MKTRNCILLALCLMTFVLTGTLPTMKRSEAKELIGGGNIGGGMLPKLNNCTSAIKSGVSRVHILDGRVPHCLLLEIFTKNGIGTAIIADDDNLALGVARDEFCHH